MYRPISSQPFSAGCHGNRNWRPIWKVAWWARGSCRRSRMYGIQCKLAQFWAPPFLSRPSFFGRNRFLGGGIGYLPVMGREAGPPSLFLPRIYPPMDITSWENLKMQPHTNQPTERFAWHQSCAKTCTSSFFFSTFFFYYPKHIFIDLVHGALTLSPTKKKRASWRFRLKHLLSNTCSYRKKKKKKKKNIWPSLPSYGWLAAF